MSSSDNHMTITAQPEYCEGVYTWYDTLSGTFKKQDAKNGTDASDGMSPQDILFDVPEGHTAQIEVTLGVDDWGILRLTDEKGGEKLSLKLTEEEGKPGPRGGHRYWKKSGTVKLPSGKYTVHIEQRNITYPEEYGIGKNNISKCDLTLTAKKENKSIRILTADQYGEIGKTGTDCTAYIKKGDQLNAKGHHAISVGLEYKGPHPDPSFEGEPKSSRDGKDNFKPLPVTLKEDGTARFKVWTEDGDATTSVELNEAKSPDISYENAVFEDLFEVTIYYTVLESKCFGEATGKVQNCRVGSLESESTVNLDHLKTDFVKAVRMEGFGRFLVPCIYHGKTYPFLGYGETTKGEYYYLSEKVLGRYNNELVEKKSCAGWAQLFNISSKRHSQIRVLLGDSLTKDFGGDVFELADVGEAIKKYHLDLYWGEDGPKSLQNLSTPAGISAYPQDGKSYRVILVKE